MEPISGKCHKLGLNNERNTHEDITEQRKRGYNNYRCLSMRVKHDKEDNKTWKSKFISERNVNF